MVRYCVVILSVSSSHLCAVGGEQFKPLADGVNHAPGRDGGAGELVELAAVLLHLPFFRQWIAE